MFDEGENEVTIKLPEIKQNVNSTEEKKQAESTTEPVVVSESWGSIFDSKAYHIEEEQPIIQKKNNPIRDYSIDTWNGNAGLQYWGYSENEPQKSK